MKRIIILFIVVATASLAVPKEIDVRIAVPNRGAVRELQDAGLMVDNYNSETGELSGVVLETRLDALRSLGYRVEILPETDARVLASQSKEPSGYPLFATYVNFMDSIAEANPAFVSLDTFGWSQGGRPLLMLKISKHVAWDEAEPKFCYISTMHGDEPPGMIFLMWFIDSLISNYGPDPRITRLVDSCEIFINPLLNPDGYVAMRRRLNSGVDPNRNYPVPDGTIGEDGRYSTDPETEAVMNWFSGHNISYVINFHTGALVANYPWDYISTRAPDDSLYKFIARNYADRNIPMFNNSGGSFDHGITNGFDWYEVDGSMQDWTYTNRGGLHLTVELNNLKTPAWSSLPGLWDDNYDAFCAAIEVTLNHGVCGIVTDSVSGDPIGATVYIESLDMETYSDSANGYYHRILLPGSYDLTFSAEGYEDKTVAVTVPDSGLATVDVQIAPQGIVYIYQSDFEADDGGMSVATFSSGHADWEWGTPSFGIVSPHSGEKLWGTVLDGEYNNQSRSRLILEDITLPTSDSIFLGFWHWFSFQDSTSGPAWHDGGNLKIWTSTDSTILSPTPGYNATMSTWNQLIPSQMAYAGLNPAHPWQYVRANISAWAGQTVDLSWDFGSSNSNTQVGWFIDDVAVYYLDPTTVSVAANNLPEETSISVSPNPFNPSCTITLREPNKNRELLIYDINGKIVRRLSAKSKTTTWDGSDESGRHLPSGIYMIRSSDGEVGARAILIK